MIAQNAEDALSREVPTHLFTFKEKIFGFFTIPQLLYDTIAFVGLWYLFNQPMPAALRIGISIAYALVVLFVVHIPIKGRSVIEWSYLYTRFFVTPKQTIWSTNTQQKPTHMLAATKSSPALPSVQSTWVPLQTINREVLGFTPGRTTKDKPKEPDTFCVVLEVTGINLNVLSQEEQKRIFSAYDTFLAGMQFGHETYTSNEPIDVQTYEPILEQKRNIARLSATPRLQALAQASLNYQHKQISTCMSTRHFVIVRASLNEVAIKADGNTPSMLSILLSFSKMKRQAKRSPDELYLELHNRCEVIRKGLTDIGLSLVPLRDMHLAQYYASTLVPGSLVLPFSQLEHVNPLQFQVAA